MSTKNVLTGIYATLLVLAGVEIAKYQGVIFNYLHIQYWQLLVGFLVLVFVWRLYRPTQLDHWWLIGFNNRVMLPLAVVAAVVCFGVESYTFTNFVFSKFGINHLMMLDVVMLTYFFSLVTARQTQLRQRMQLNFFIIFLLLCFYVYTYNYPFFASLSRNASGQDDDNFMEWLQVIILIGGSIIPILLAKKATNLVSRIIYILAAIFFIILAGEEISWGERLVQLHVQTNNSNYQGELNLHNQSGANEVTALLYYVAFIYAVISWRIRIFIRRRRPMFGAWTWLWKLATFRGVEVVYLVPTFIFNPYADRTVISSLPPMLDIYHSLGLIPDFFQTLSFLATWRETFEVLFYLALVLHFWNILRSSYFVQATHQTDKSKIPSH